MTGDGPAAACFAEARIRDLCLLKASCFVAPRSRSSWYLGSASAVKREGFLWEGFKCCRFSNWRQARNSASSLSRRAVPSVERKGEPLKCSASHGLRPVAAQGHSQWATAIAFWAQGRPRTPIKPLVVAVGGARGAPLAQLWHVRVRWGTSLLKQSRPDGDVPDIMLRTRASCNGSS